MIKKEELKEGLEMTKNYIKSCLDNQEYIKDHTSSQYQIKELEEALKNVLENIEVLQSERFQKSLMMGGIK